MKSYLLKVLTLILATVFIIATSGIPVFHHFCNTNKTSEYAFFFTDFNCDHEHESQHANETRSCCSVDQGSCEDNQCCNTEAKVYKLDIDLDFQKTLKLSVDQTLISELELQNLTDPITESLGMIYFYHDLPPPLAGKELKIFLHQLTIPEHVV
jgi:hypothetical protein